MSNDTGFTATTPTAGAPPNRSHRHLERGRLRSASWRAVLAGAVALMITVAMSVFGASTAHAGGTPAKVLFGNCTDWQLAQFAVMPEVGGVAMKFPKNGIWYLADGLWVRGTPASWVKLPGSQPRPAEYIVECSSTGWRVINWWPGLWPFMASWQPAATAPVGYPF